MATEEGVDPLEEGTTTMAMSLERDRGLAITRVVDVLTAEEVAEMLPVATREAVVTEVATREEEVAGGR
eukprot:CAMPEP_0198283490 /NCGR_PEP_ID=MMETSP1449-20131203/3063_1 /TAXON_ID=420275 /ORGANISM="Attheya septentrionalis, Strain CCMP2084" /LENGTH=68 /DNA_ID=CAMNT_0043980105 /DNA_START=69 /DNA_END=271 /DNA_ORIENTATION=+